MKNKFHESICAEGMSKSVKNKFHESICAEGMSKNMKKFLSKKILSFFPVLLIAIIVFAGCSADDEEPLSRGNTTVNAEEIGTGETVFRLEVTDAENNITAWSVSTNEQTVGSALLALGLIAGDDGAFGLMVTTVNNITADWSYDGSWWAFYVNDELSPVGVDSAYIEPGATYAFVFSR
ncbi:MAG: DUF4430 domain-containing protein [Defluviitaleaceae bacterium]|nr:DUF4430 domain-containing protein [Defluviitaleaceae bacterium]